MKIDLFYLTRSSSFLWKSTAGILLVFLVLGLGLSQRQSVDANISGISSGLLSAQPQPGEGLESADLARAILRIQLSSKTEFSDQLERIERLVITGAFSASSILPPPEKFSTVSPSGHRILTGLIDAIHTRKALEDKEPESDSATTAIEAAASFRQIIAEESDIPGAGFAAAIYHRAANEYESAITAALHEIERFDSAAVKRWLIETCLNEEDYDRIHRLRNKDAFRPFINHHLIWTVAIAERNWREVIIEAIPAAYEDTPLPIFGLALLTGLIWSVVLLRIGDQRCSLWPLGLVALLFGALSAHATVFVILLQESYLELFEGGGMWRQIAYTVAGIGLREEALKLVFFLPILALMRRRSDDLSLLVVASMVGLGFAMEENINYFQSSDGVSALGRFVTANFLHISLTGLVGWSAGRCIFEGGKEIGNALSLFGLAIIAHGAYDAFLIVPQLYEYSLFAMTIFILIGQQYFGRIAYIRTEWRDSISVTALFTWGVGFVLGASFLVASSTYGFVAGLHATGSGFLSVAVILFMFYREIPESVA